MSQPVKEIEKLTDEVLATLNSNIDTNKYGLAHENLVGKNEEISLEKA